MQPLGPPGRMLTHAQASVLPGGQEFLYSLGFILAWVWDGPDAFSK